MQPPVKTPTPDQDRSPTLDLQVLLAFKGLKYRLMSDYLLAPCMSLGVPLLRPAGPGN